jgi:putative DNA methylase
MLSSKVGKEVYVDPVIKNNGYSFTVRTGKPKDLEKAKNGTKSGGSHSVFLCLMSGTSMPFEYLRAEARAGRMGVRLMAMVVEGDRGRMYLSPTHDSEVMALSAKPDWKPDIDICHWPGRTNVVEYGLTKFSDLFTPRQLVTLTTFSNLIERARELVIKDASDAGFSLDGMSLISGSGSATAYGDAISVYLTLAVDRMANTLCTIARWTSDRQQTVTAFSRQAIPMTWDYPDVNPFAGAAGDYSVSVDGVIKGIPSLTRPNGIAKQVDASTQDISKDKIISTDPPYYDNIEYADLSDFFYVWLRHSLKSVFPNLFTTLSVPKEEELVANPYRRGSKQIAEEFFLRGMSRAMNRLSELAHPEFPVTIYYAFKQSENDEEEGIVSTGWDTFLDAVIHAGFALTGTWPMRTEMGNRMIGSGNNALASSIVLVCRKHLPNAPIATRREFVNVLQTELPIALAHLQASNIAPVDLAQAAIGPGMAVYTRYAKVLDAQGQPLSVRQALALINQTLDEVLAEQEGDFDADTRWALAWFEQHGFSEGEYGVAETLSKAKDTSVGGMVEAGILASGRGKVRLLKPAELPEDWDPAADKRLTAWEMVHQLIRALESDGESGAARLMARLGAKAETARELCYRLYTVCERKKRAAEALSYNALVQSWPEVARLARERIASQPTQDTLF